MTTALLTFRPRKYVVFDPAFGSSKGYKYRKLLCVTQKWCETHNTTKTYSHELIHLPSDSVYQDWCLFRLYSPKAPQFFACSLCNAWTQILSKRAPAPQQRVKFGHYGWVRLPEWVLMIRDIDIRTSTHFTMEPKTAYWVSVSRVYIKSNRVVLNF